MQGHFVVKQKYGSFNAVAGDMKLEQTISIEYWWRNRSN